MWLANAVEETNGNVTTVELSSERVGEALANFEKANLLQRIDVHNQAEVFLDSQLDHSI